MAQCPAWIDHASTVLSAAQLMRKTGVSHVVVAECVDGTPVPLSVISAQDIVARVMAVGLDPGVVTVGDVLSTKAAPALEALLRRMA